MKTSRDTFMPLFYDPARYLSRQRLLDRIMSSQAEKRNLILIEAQAGQGKSVFAAQYLACTQSVFSWYQVKPEDRDTVLFITSLHHTLMQTLPGFQCSLLQKMIEHGELNADENTRYADILLRDLEGFLKQDTCIVMDDLHLLEPFSLSARFISALLNRKPGKLHFILISRQAVFSILPALQRHHPPIVIRNEALALNHGEIAELFNGILKIPVSREMVQELFRVTQGWPLGLILIGQAFREGSHTDMTARLSVLQAAKQEEILTYFLQEVFSKLPVVLRNMLLKLSLLEEIPVRLVSRLTGKESLRPVFDYLEKNNSFVRYLNDDGSRVAFHHLFRDCLRIQACKTMTPEQRKNVLRQAADWYLASGLPETALHYYLEAGDYQTAQSVLRRVGLKLLADNRMITLLTTLKKIPENVIREYGWLSFLYGVVCMSIDPPGAFEYLTAAQERFHHAEEAIGELLVITQRIYFHIGIDGRQSQDSPLVKRAVELFRCVSDSLDIQHRIQAADAIAKGYFWFDGDMRKGEAYSLIALRLARENTGDNLMAAAGITRCYRYFFQGKWQSFNQEFEQLAVLRSSPRVNLLHKRTIEMLAVTALEAQGDFVNFEYRKKTIEQNLDENILQKSVLGAYRMLRDLDREIARGNFQVALELVDQGLALEFACRNAHLRSQFLCYRAYLLALEGNAADACAAAEKALQERCEIGGMVFILVSQMLVGGAYVQLRMRRSAEKLLESAIRLSRNIGEAFMRAGIYAHRAFLRLETGRMKSAIKDIDHMLTCMKNHDYVHFWSWTPPLMKKILSAAVQNEIEVDYARYLAAERLHLAFLPDGREIPLLEICTLGRFYLKTEDCVGVRAEDLTSAQRELLALLISSPGNVLSTAEIQLALWPDSSAQKGRSRLDNLMMRLRKKLAESFAPHSVNHYLSIDKGMVRLKNCTIDAERFVRYTRKGIEHFERREFWQADNAFHAVYSLFEGEYLAGIYVEGAVYRLKNEILRLYIESICKWSEILSGSGRDDDAIRVATEALTYDATHDILVKTLYQFYIKAEKPVKARQVIEQYRQALMQHEFLPEEIDDIIESFWSKAV